MNMQITEEQYYELLLTGLDQIARDAEQLGSGNITHRAAQIRANALQLKEITREVIQQESYEKEHESQQHAKKGAKGKRAGRGAL